MWPVPEEALARELEPGARALRHRGAEDRLAADAHVFRRDAEVAGPRGRRPPPAAAAAAAAAAAGESPQYQRRQLILMGAIFQYFVN